MKYKPSSAAVLAGRFLRPGDTVIEIGAADGDYTAVYAAHVGSSGRVIAVDPHPDHVRQLEALAVAWPQVTVVPMAVGSIEGEAPFFHDAGNPKRSSLYSTNVSVPGRVSQVRMTTIDALVLSLGVIPALIQIDAQGAEASILAGAQATLVWPIVWVLEVWPAGLRQAGATVTDAIGQFQTRTFLPHSVHGASMSWPATYKAMASHGVHHADVVMLPDVFAGAVW